MPEMREILSGLGCETPTHNYLGDGVYCGIDGLPQVWLVAERDGFVHKIALDTDTLGALWRYAKMLPPP